jgi:hypothetical protein
MHGGSVAASSAGPGRGSEFIVRLPTRMDPEQATAMAVPAIGDSPLPRRRVLVVDDNVDAADSRPSFCDWRVTKFRPSTTGRRGSKSPGRSGPRSSCRISACQGHEICMTRIILFNVSE